MADVLYRAFALAVSIIDKNNGIVIGFKNC